VDAGVCNPKTCANYPGTCGQHSDGCGGLTANCATCPANQYCGGGGAGVCGGGAALDGGACNPWTCTHYPGTCGQHSDGCGGLTANCGTCTPDKYCGGGGPGICGGSTGLGPDGGPISNCVKKTCAGQGYTCGLASDGCGGTIGPCGPACTLPLVCGGGGPSKPNVCGSNLPCTGLCLQQQACDGGAATLSGTVVAGTIAKYLCAGQTTQGNCNAAPGCSWTAGSCKGATYGDPVPDVLVYIPTTTVSAFVSRANENAAARCSSCGADVTGSPLVTTTTAYDGTFTLNNVPVGSGIPLVIQLGRWRRQFTVNLACGTNTLNATSTPDGTVMPAGILKMPNNKAVGDIPLTAISTGNVDAMECVLIKMGIDAAEFTNNPGTGRVHIYQGNGAGSSNGGANNETTLMGSNTVTGTWNNYDQILFPCWGNPVAKNATPLANLITYADTGGHFFATHYSYTWLNTNAEFGGTAVWDVNANNNIASTVGTVSQLPPTAHPAVFVNWLNYVNPGLDNRTGAPPPPNPAHLTITAARHNVDTVSGNSTSWITGTDPAPGGGSPATMLLHYTFDTPVTPPAGGKQCGHAIYSDFHVADSNTNNYNFPADADTYCGATPMTAQEKVLEFMIWDLASCVPPPASASCTPMTCANFPTGTCGAQGDGCGGLTANCGTCPAGQTCGGAGVAGQCGGVDGGSCTPQTCATQPIGTCGQQADGCGGLTTSCNVCPPGQTCGGGGVAGVCGAPSSSCTPLTCTSYPTGTCGQQADGCGGLTSNCACPAGQSCVSGQCQANPTCSPQTCSSYATGTCGQQADGCGGLTANCPCPSGQSCGGAGVAGQCGTPPTQGSCVPLTCAAYPGICGKQSDGCGGLTADCNPCTAPATCGGGGQAGVCGTPPDASGCIPQTCAAFPSNCGVQSDGCGGLTAYCNPCTAPATCGGGGTPGVCGSPPPPACTKLTCANYPATTCGQQSDGCGGLTNDCNPCTPPNTCGGAGVAGMCGMPPMGSCVAKTCADYPNVCGQQSDGCGGLTPVCNPCPGTQTCGGGGTTGVCGTGGTCTPKTCAQLGFNCGAAGDGCGGLLNCGTCPSGQSCGSSGTPGVCSNLPM
jgi:hypothetical protein